MLISAVTENLTGAMHSGSLNKVRNYYAALERAQNTLLQKIDPLETQRLLPLAQVIHDDLTVYPLPSDFKKLIDLAPQDNRSISDYGKRVVAPYLDLQRAIKNKQISIEGSEGSKILKANWKSQQAKTLNAMNSLTANGTWSVVGTATGLKIQTVYKISGSASIEFDSVNTGDGIQNTTMTAVDLTTEDEIADVIFPVFLSSTANVTSISALWGNDLTTNFWTGVAQTTQADGTAFKAGWNWIKVPWSTATETGAVDPAAIDSFRITLATTGAVSNIRVDNITFSLGRAFDLTYYGKYIFKTTAGAWVSRPTSEDDTMVLDNDSQQIFLMESLKAIAQQVEGEDSTFDIDYANKELYGNMSAPDPVGRLGLYAKYRSEFPSASRKAVQRWSSGPRFRN